MAIFSNQLLRLKEAPFFFTVLLAFCGWIVTHMVDRLQQSPIVGYRVDQGTGGNKQSVVVTVENLAADKCFRNITFSLVGPEKAGERFTNIVIKYSRPGKARGNPSIGEKYASVTFEEFHPRWRFAFAAEKIGTFEPQIMFKSEAASLESNEGDIQAVRLIKEGFSTSMLRHEMIILLSLLGFATIVLTAYLIWLNQVVAGGRPATAIPP